MARISLRLAETEADVEDARALCRAWVDWQLAVFPEHAERIRRKFEPVAYARELADLPVIHARPGGAILLARLDGRPAGCVMYHPAGPDFAALAASGAGVAEVKRLFVEAGARGHGIGRALLTEMFSRMRGDGYGRVAFTSADFLTHARALYESVGFCQIARPEGLPPFVYAMARDL